MSGVEQGWWEGTAACGGAPAAGGLSASDLRQQLPVVRMVALRRGAMAFLGICESVDRSARLRLASERSGERGHPDHPAEPYPPTRRSRYARHPLDPLQPINLTRIGAARRPAGAAAPARRPLSAKTHAGAEIRVDHAGEYGAKRTQGQTPSSGDGKKATSCPTIARIRNWPTWRIDRLIVERGVGEPMTSAPGTSPVRPGAANRAFWRRRSMACTVSVKQVIDRHNTEPSRPISNDRRRRNCAAHHPSAYRRGAGATATSPGTRSASCAATAASPPPSKAGSRAATWWRSG